MCDRKRKKNRPEPLEAGACILCKSVEDDEFQYGRFYRIQNISVHYYCVLFACALPQNGRSSREGVEGFMVRDIIAESNRGARLRCSYCSQTGATVGCCLKKCKRVFHLPCGMNNGAMNQFFGQFCSYCSDHKPKQDIKKSDIVDDILCTVCYGPIQLKDRDSFLKASCCASNWFHRKCIQLYALSAGYFFKCTLCNDKEEFEREMLQYGIYIPKQDASWEKERNAYRELLVRAKCDAAVCHCPKGRQENKESSRWHLVYCEDCGSTARHVGCENLSLKKLIWRCCDCIEFNKKLVTKRLQEKKLQPCITEAGTSSSRSRNQNLNIKNKAVLKLLKQCKDCVVKVPMLSYDDMPINVRKKRWHLLKHLKKASRKAKLSTASRTSPRKKHSKIHELKSSETQNRKAKIKLYNDASATPTCSSSASEAHVQSKNNRTVETYQKGMAKQTLIEGFFRGQTGNDKHKLFLENTEVVQNKQKRKTNVDCFLKQVSETTVSTSVTSMKNFSAKNAFVTNSNCVLLKMTKTVNFYCKGIDNFFQVNPFQSPEKSTTALMNTFEDPKFSERNFSQVMRNFVSPLPALSESLSISEIGDSKASLSKKEKLRKCALTRSRTPSGKFKSNCIAKSICAENQFSKSGTIKTYLRSAISTFSNEAGTSKKLHVYIDLKHISGIRIIDNDALTRCVPSTLSVHLEDCLKSPSSKAIAPSTTSHLSLNHTITSSSVIQTENSFNSSSLVKFNNSFGSLNLENNYLRNDDFRKNLQSTSETAISTLPLENLHNEAVNVDPKSEIKPPLMIKLEPDEFIEKLMQGKASAIGILKREQRFLQSSSNVTVIPMSATKCDSPLVTTPTVSKVVPTTPALTLQQKIMTNVTNAFKKNLVHSALPIACDQENDKSKQKNTCIEKYLHMSGSGPKPTISTEKRKKRLRIKTETTDKKSFQSNTLLSYFFTL